MPPAAGPGEERQGEKQSPLQARFSDGTCYAGTQTFRQVREYRQGQTAYDSLDAYVDAGLVRRSIYDDGIARYEIAAEHRHFLTCTACKKSVPLSVCPFEQLEEQLVRETGFQISGHKMEFFGLCPECAKKMGQERRGMAVKQD